MQYEALRHWQSILRTYVQNIHICMQYKVGRHGHSILGDCKFFTTFLYKIYTSQSHQQCSVKLSAINRALRPRIAEHLVDSVAWGEHVNCGKGYGLHTMHQNCTYRVFFLLVRPKNG